MPEIFVFGDSITYGIWDSEGGWVQRLRKQLDKEVAASKFAKYWLVYNMGVSGDTTKDLLRRMERELLQRRDKDEETIILIAIGINDSKYYDKEQRTKTAEEEFRANIQRISEVARKHAQKVFFIGLTPVDEARTVPWTKGRSLRNREVQKFNLIIKKECSAKFIGLLEHFIPTDFNLLLQDGLHPNSEGHKKIYNIVRTALEKEKII